MVVVFVAWMGLIVLRSYVDPTLDIWYVSNYTLGSLMIYKIGILVGMASLLQLSSVLVNNRLLVYLSGLTFFAFLFHLVPLVYIVKAITMRFLPEYYGLYVNFPMAVVMVFLAGHIMAKFMPALYAKLTGGRDPSKALKRRLVMHRMCVYLACLSKFY